MEAVPKLPMLKFDLKLSSDNGDFSDTIKKLIKNTYNEDPEAFTKELDEIGKLRSNSCIRPKEDFTGVTEVKRYYSQLHLLQNRFKFESGDKGPFNFSWNDPYAGTLYTLPDFDYELACVLYNLGALHTILGATEKRDSSESMKVACTHFQCAAWAFHTLPDRYPKVYTPDISPDVLAVMSQICLAQAQECILEKSILDHRKSSIIAKVGAQVSEYYFAALHKLESSNARHLTSDILLLGVVPEGEETVMESIGHKNNRNWIRHIEFKLVYHRAVAHLYAGLHAEESQKMGERIAHFQASSDNLMDCTKLVTSSAKDSGIWKDCLTFANDVIKGKLDNAKKENEFIYHEKIPDLDNLNELKGASLVKGIGFEVTDPEVVGTDIFSRLVPLEAHEASSLYSEEKAKLLRSIGDEIESKNNELAIFMSSMSLDEDGVVPKPDDQIALPQELIEVAASLSVKGEDTVTGHLKSAMARIAAVSVEVETSLKEIREYLKEDAEQEEEYVKILTLADESGQHKIGGRGHLTEEISRECEKYEGAHKMASDSNATLHSAMRLHMDNIRLLTLPLEKLQKEIPSLADLDDDSEANIAEVRRILSKVEEMKEQRAKLAEDFRCQVMNDDITKKLVVHKDKEMPEIFDIELKKHERARKVLRQNLLAQENILKALTEINAKYVNTRRIISDLINSRNEMIGSLVASFYAHEDLLHKAAKGLEFYDKLDSNVTKLLHRVQGVIKVQQEERDAVLAKQAPPRKDVDRGIAPLDQIGNYQPGAPPYMGTVSSTTVQDTAGIPHPFPISGTGISTADTHVTRLEDCGSSVTGKPTLKDYLKIMKETKGDASAAYAAVNNLQPIAVDTCRTSTSPQIPPFTGLPAVRPTPVGSECVDEPPIKYHNPQLYNIASNQRTPYLQAPNNPSNEGEIINHHSQYSISPGAPRLSGTTNFYPNQCIQQSNPIGYQQPSSSASAMNTNFSILNAPTSAVPRVKEPYITPMNTTRVATEYDSNQHLTQVTSIHQESLASKSGNISIFPSSQLNAYPTSFSTNMPSVATAGIPQVLGGPATADKQYQIRHPTVSVSIPTAISGAYYQTLPTTSVPMSYGNVNTVQSMIPSVANTHNYETQSGQGYHQQGQAQNYTSTAGNDYQYYHTPNLQIGIGTNPTIGGYDALSKTQTVSTKMGSLQNAQSIPYGNGSHGYSNMVSYANPSATFSKPTGMTLSTTSALPSSIENSLCTTSTAHVGFPSTISTPLPQSHSTFSTHNVQQYVPYTVSSVAQIQGSNEYLGQRSSSQPNSGISQLVRKQPIESNTSQQYPCAQTGNLNYINQTNEAGYGQSLAQPYVPRQENANVSKDHCTQAVIFEKYSTHQNTVASGLDLKSRGQSIAQLPEGISNITPIKMKPIVPQPGTTSTQPNVNLNMNIPINASLQRTQELAITNTSNIPTGNLQPSNAGIGTSSVVRRSTSFDDMLHNEQEDNDGTSSIVTLQPKVMTAEELAEQKRQAKAFNDIAKATNQDPYEDRAKQNKLLEDVILLENKISLAFDSDNQRWLNEKWKLFNTLLTTGSGTGELAIGGGALSVARCYPMKNRASDVLPFDSSRVELPTTKDDYINASHIRHLSPHAPCFIATQWPPANTHNDFWTMIWQEQIEIIVCLLADSPAEKDIYWPKERKEPLKLGNASSGTGQPGPGSTNNPLEITLQSIKFEEGQTKNGKATSLSRTERILTLLNRATNTSRVVIHIQLAANANSTGKILVQSLCDLSVTCLTYHRQQRVPTHPIVVHCLEGSGRTSSFILMVAAMSEINVATEISMDGDESKRSNKSMSEIAVHDNFKIMPDLVKMAALMCQQRKGMLRERHHFKQAYEGMLAYGRNILVKKGLLEAIDTNSNFAADKGIRQDIATGVDVQHKNEFISDPEASKTTSNILPDSAKEIDSNIKELELPKVESVGASSVKKAMPSSASNFLPSELTNKLIDLNLSDPLGLTTSNKSSPHRRRITKQDFFNASNSISKIGSGSADDVNDPLSKLDPLWSMK